MIGSAFYVMDCVEGRVLWDPQLPGFDARRARRDLRRDEPRRSRALHKVDYAAVGLADYGKPGNYFARQIGRWTKQYSASETETIEAMDALIAWLPAHIPAERRDVASCTATTGSTTSIFHPTEPRMLAVLDWELSTLGHPLADFALQLHALAHRTARASGRARGRRPRRARHPDRAGVRRRLLPAHRAHRRRALELLSRLLAVPARVDRAGGLQARARRECELRGGDHVWGDLPVAGVSGLGHRLRARPTGRPLKSPDCCVAPSLSLCGIPSGMPPPSLGRALHSGDLSGRPSAARVLPKMAFASLGRAHRPRREDWVVQYAFEPCRVGPRCDGVVQRFRGGGHGHYCG